MRKILFLSITERLEQVVWIGGVPTFEPDAAKREGCRRVFWHFDLWNENIPQLVKQRPFPTPAVFFEFEPVRWSYVGLRVREADVVLRLHVITATVATAETGNRYRDKASSGSTSSTPSHRLCSDSPTTTASARPERCGHTNPPRITTTERSARTSRAG